jgi:hypothetical protein
MGGGLEVWPGLESAGWSCAGEEGGEGRFAVFYCAATENLLRWRGLLDGT